MPWWAWALILYPPVAIPIALILGRILRGNSLRPPPDPGPPRPPNVKGPS